MHSLSAARTLERCAAIDNRVSLISGGGLIRLSGPLPAQPPTFGYWDVQHPVENTHGIHLHTRDMHEKFGMPLRQVPRSQRGQQRRGQSAVGETSNYQPPTPKEIRFERRRGRPSGRPSPWELDVGNWELLPFHGDENLSQRFRISVKVSFTGRELVRLQNERNDVAITLAG